VASLVYTRPFLYPKQEAAIFSSKRWALCEASTKSGKTVGAIAWIIEQALRGERGWHYWWVAPIADQARIAFSRIKAGLTPGTFTARETPTPTITILNGAVIDCKSADRPDSLYGEDVFGGVFDEASRSQAEAWHAFRSTLTQTRGSAVLIGNVKGRKNWFYEFCRRVEKGDEPNGSYQRITWRDAVEAGVLDIEEIEDARRNLPEMVFRELYEAQASDDGGNPFGLQHIAACIGPISNQPPAAFGVDLAKSQDWFVVTGLDISGRVCHFSRWQHVPWRESVRRVHAIVGEDTPTLVDSTGLGDPVLEELQVGHGNISGFHFSNLSKQRIIEGLAVGIQSHEIQYPEGPISAELEVFEFERRGGRWYYSAPEGYHDDCVYSLALSREQLTATVPGANMIGYMQAAGAAEAVEQMRIPTLAEETRAETRELMPWRVGPSASDLLDNDLNELYEDTIRNHPTMRRQLICAGCGQAITDLTRISDGMHFWHAGCARLGLNVRAA